MTTNSLFANVLFVSIITLTSLKSFGINYHIETKLKPEQHQALQNALNLAQNILPKKISAALQTVTVKVEKKVLSGDQEFVARLNSANHLIISESYISELMLGPVRATRTPERQHKNKYNEAIAAILHETVHIYDEANIHSSEEKALIFKCRNLNNSQAVGKGTDARNWAQKSRVPAICRYYTHMTKTFSQNPHFLHTAGWVGLNFNGFKQRSPDIYELKNSQEYLAVNMEYFLLDAS